MAQASVTARASRLEPAADWDALAVRARALRRAKTAGLYAFLIESNTTLPLTADEVLTTTHDFFATHEALRLKATRTNAAVRRVRLYARSESASVDEIVGNLLRAVAPQTRVVAITWVHSSTGVKTPVRAIADMLANTRTCP